MGVKDFLKKTQVTVEKNLYLEFNDMIQNTNIK